MIRLNATWRFIAVAGVASVALAACGSSSGGGGSSTPTSAGGGGGTPLYLTDGNLGTGPIGELPKGTMVGTKGTTPGAASSQAFKNELNKINPKLPTIGYSYGPEAYDAVVLVALSAQAAKSDAGRNIAKQMQAVSSGGTACTSFDQCNKLLKQGEDIDYNGVSGPIEFDQFGDETKATIGVYQYNEANTVPGLNAPVDTALPVTYSEGSLPKPTGPAPVLTSKVNSGANGQLVIGGLLPITGSLSSLGPPEIAGVQAAVQDINKAGGVLGKPVTFISGDSGDTTTDTASLTVNKQLQKGVDAIIGAASSSVTLSVIDAVTGAGVIQVSPANTSPELSDYPDNGLYFRTAPSDQLQGRVLADQVIADGFSNIAIISRQDSYGEGLTKYVTQFIKQGGGNVVSTEYYDDTATTFSSQVSATKAAGPDAIVLVGFDESGKVITEMVKQGIGPNG